MSDPGFTLTELRTRLTLAENRRKNDELSLRDASNKYAREEAERQLAESTKEVARLQREIEALEQ
jgi:hypothetical protein